MEAEKPFSVLQRAGDGMSLKVRAECLEAQSPITLQDGDTLGMDGEESAVLPSLGDVGLSRLLEGQESRSSELGISGVGQ